MHMPAKRPLTGAKRSSSTNRHSMSPDQQARVAKSALPPPKTAKCVAAKNALTTRYYLSEMLTDEQYYEDFSDESDYYEEEYQQYEYPEPTQVVVFPEGRFHPVKTDSGSEPDLEDSSSSESDDDSDDSDVPDLHGDPPSDCSDDDMPDLQGESSDDYSDTDTDSDDEESEDDDDPVIPELVEQDAIAKSSVLRKHTKEEIRNMPEYEEVKKFFNGQFRQPAVTTPGYDDAFSYSSEDSESILDFISDEEIAARKRVEVRRRRATWNDFNDRIEARKKLDEVSLARRFASILQKDGGDLSLADKNWAKIYLDGQSVQVRAMGLSQLGLIDRRPYVQYCKERGVDFSEKTVGDLNSLQVFDSDGGEIPIVPYVKGSFQYWKYCVDEHWPKRCPTCSTSLLYPRESTSEHVRCCSLCSGVDHQSLLDRCETDFGIPKGTIKPEMIGSIGALLKTMITTAGTFMGDMKNVAHDKIASKLGKLLQDAFGAAVKGYIDTFVKALPDLLRASALVCLSLMIMSMLLDIMRASAGIIGDIIMSVMGLFAIAGCKILESIIQCYDMVFTKGKSYRTKDKTVIPEEDESLAVQIITCLLMVLGPASSGVSVVTITKALASARGLLTGVSLARSTLEGLVEHLPKALSNYISSHFGLIKAAENSEERSCVMRCQRVLTTLRRDPKLAYKKDTAAEIVYCHSIIQDILSRKAFSRRPTSPLFAALGKELAGFLPACEHTLGGTSERQEPVGLYIQSPPGYGKSYMAQILATAVAPHLTDSMRLYTHTRAQYMTGYHGQFFHHIDELGSSSSPEERAIYECILRWVSVAHEECNMAAVEDKGMNYTSKVLLITTNHDITTTDNPLKYQGALHRRMHYFQASLAEGWANSDGRLDGDIISKRIEEGTLSMKEAAFAPWLRFQLFQIKTVTAKRSEKIPAMVDGRPVIYDMRQLITYTKAQVQKKSEAYDRRIENIRILREMVCEEQTKMFGRSKTAEEVLQSDKGKAIFELYKEDLELEDVDDVVEATYASLLEAVEKIPPDLPPVEVETPDIFDSIPDDGIDVSPEMEKNEDKVPKCNNSNSQSSTDDNAPDGFNAKMRRKIKRAHARHAEQWAQNRINRLSERYEKAHTILPDPAENEFQRKRFKCDMLKNAYKYLGIKYKETRSWVARKTEYARAIFWGVAKRLWVSRWSNVCRIVMSTIFSSSIILLTCYGINRLSEKVMHKEPVEATTEDNRLPPGAPIMRAKQHAPFGRRGVPTVRGYQKEEAGVIEPFVPLKDVTGLEEPLRRAVKNNWGRIYMPAGTTGGWFAATGKWNCPLHVFYKGSFPKQGTPFTIESDGVTKNFKFDVNKLVVVNAKGSEDSYIDWCCYDTAHSFPTKTNMIKYFASEKDLARHWHEKCLLVSTEKVIELDGMIRGKSRIPSYHAGEKSLSLQEYWEYPPDTKGGDCGYILASTRKNSTQQFIGSHIAKVNIHAMRSTSLQISKEFLRYLNNIEDEELPAFVLDEVTLELPRSPSANVPLGEVCIGKIPKHMRRHETGNTKYIKSAIANTELCERITKSYAPAVQGHKNDERCKGMTHNRLKLRRKDKYVKGNTVPYHPDFVSIANQISLACVRPGSTSILTWDECLNGVPGCAPFPRSSSIGWPAKLDLEQGGKLDVIHFGEDNRWHCKADFEATLDEMLEAVRSGRPIECFFQVLGKDEVLPNRKNDKMDMRTITLVPFAVNMVIKALYGSFAASSVSGARTCKYPWMIGMDVQSQTYDTMIKKMHEVGWKGFDGDHGGFEFNHDSDAFETFYAHTSAYYMQDGSSASKLRDDLARRTLMQLYTHPKILLGDSVYVSHTEFSSGLLTTAIFNSFASFYHVAVGYASLADEHNLCEMLSSKDYNAAMMVKTDGTIKSVLSREEFTVQSFFDNVRVFTTGDDHVVSISQLISPWFNGRNFAEFMTSHGREYTPADKAAEFGPDRPVVDLGFLSGRTVTHALPLINGQDYYYVLNRDNALKQLSYVSIDAGERGLAANIDSCLRSQWGLGRRSFCDLRQRIIESCDSVHYEVNPITWEQEYNRRVSLSGIVTESFATGSREFFSTMVTQSMRGTGNYRTKFQMQRLLATAKEVVRDHRVVMKDVRIGQLRKGHCIQPNEMHTVYERACALYKTKPSRNWLLDARIDSTAGLWYVQHKDQTWACDGNSRTAAMIMAAAWKGLDDDFILSLPIREVTSKDSLHSLTFDAPVGGCSVCSMEDCDCSLLRPPQDEGVVYPEMESQDLQEGGTNSLDEELPTIQPAPGSAAAPEPLTDADRQNVMEMCKRKGRAIQMLPVAQAITTYSASCVALLAGTSATATNFNVNSAWPHRWLVPLYSMYSGATRFTSIQHDDHRLIGSVANLTQAQVLQQVEGDHAGLLPQELTNIHSSFTSVQVPYLSIYNGVRIPITPAEALEETSIAGSVTYFSVNTETYGDIFISMADDSLLSLLWRVPRLKVVARPGPVTESFEHVTPRTKTRSKLRKPMVIPEMLATAGKGMNFQDSGSVGIPVVKRAMGPLPETMKDENFSFVDMLQRSQKLTTVLWSSTQVADVQLLSKQCPKDFFIGAAANAVKSFNYFRGNLTVRFNVQSNPMQSGMLIASILPLRSSVASQAAHTNSLEDRTINPHCFLRAGCNSVVELTLPYVHPKPMLDPSDPAEMPMFTLLLSVLNPLGTGPDSDPNCQISVFTWFSDVELLVVKPVVLTEGAQLSSFSSNVAKVAKDTVDVAETIEGVAGRVFDKPNIGLNPPTVVRKGLPYLANSTNVEYSQVMALQPNRCVNQNAGMLGTTVSETDMEYLLSKWTMISRSTFGSSTLSGSILAEGQICPVQTAPSKVLGQEFSESLLGYMSLLHSYWSGPIELKFDFIGTRFHTFRLVFVTHYGGVSTETTLLQATQQNMVSYDYSYESPSLVVELPWRVPTNMLKVPPHAEFIPRIHTAGMWSLRLDTELVAPETVYPGISFNLSIRAGKGFKLHGLYESSMDYEPVLDYL